MKYFPIYLLEIVITFITGAMSSAISNHLILELSYSPAIAGSITGLFFIGFFFATLLLGHISDTIGLEKVLKIIFSVKIICNVFYLIPIRSDLQLVLFGLVYMFDGCFNGVFWPTVQNYSIFIENARGKDEKTKFTRGYHLSWNLGFILGQIGGTLVVYISSSNYLVFFLGVFGAVIGFLDTWFLIGKIGKPDVQINHIDGVSEKSPEIERARQGSKSNFPKVAFYSVILILLTHSLTDGVIVILLPLKTASIAVDGYWVFLLGLFKLVSQTWATTKFSSVTSKRALIFVILAETLLIVSWQFFLFSEALLVLVSLLMCSGAAQGAIYALNMNLTARKASHKKSARPFAFFQASMSGGRTMGALILGFVASISFNVGIWLLIAYEIFALTVFILKNIRI